MKEISAFGCDYCAMTSRTKHNVARHEKKYCRKNPNRKTCGQCKNLSYDDEDGYFCDQIEGYIEHPLNIGTDCKYFDVKHQPPG